MSEIPDREIFSNLYAVVMAGGKGTRFWPLSRETFPKQFLRLHGERTLLQETINRLSGAIEPENFLVVTTCVQRDLVVWQTREVNSATKYVVEPEGKNTAPAVALAALKLYMKNPDALLLVLPSDHDITNEEAFFGCVEKAVKLAKKGYITTFGIVPRGPETGYGYIKAGGRLGDEGYTVERFTEKPDIETAKGFISDGGYYWNSGMFVFSASVMLEQLKTHMPPLYEALWAVRDSLNTDDEEQALCEAYQAVEPESIDYGVMERSEKAAMVEGDFGWSDIGSWSALDDVMEAGPEGNITRGNSVAFDCEGTIFYGENRLLAAIGLKDMIVVDTQDATLICPKSRAQDVKKIVDMLKEQGKGEYLSPKVESRPWGYFTVLEEGPQYKIKQIGVEPKKRLSLQMHNHRSEHWIVLSGTAKVTRGEDVFYINQNESTFIPSTVKHRLENPGMIPLIIIEIQSGQYLEEDDIVRFEDIYGR